MVGSRVYVGGLPFGVRERDLEKFFKGFGRVRDILIKNGYGFVEFEDHRDADDAVYELNGKELLGERVVVEPARGIDRSAERHRRGDRDRGHDRDRGRSRYERTSTRGSGSSRGEGRQTDKEPHNDSRYGPPTRTEYRLVVENLSSRISWQDLKDYMRQAGEVTYADAHKQHRSEGVVEFATNSDMRAAIEKLDGTELNGRRIKLVEDKRAARRRTRSSSSRSRSRSRDRPSRARRSRSRRSSRSRSRSNSKSRPKSKSPVAKSRSRSRSKVRRDSKSPAGSHGRRSVSRKSDERSGRERERSKSRDAKRSVSKERSRSRSKEASPKRTEERKSASKSRSRSRSRSAHSRSRSGSRSARSRSASPRQNGDAANGRASAERSPRSGD